MCFSRYEGAAGVVPLGEGEVGSSSSASLLGDCFRLFGVGQEAAQRRKRRLSCGGGGHTKREGQEITQVGLQITKSGIKQRSYIPWLYFFFRRRDITSLFYTRFGNLESNLRYFGRTGGTLR
jgi:hypothetical protein